MRNINKIAFAAGVVAAAFAAPAWAGVELANPSSFNGAEILFNTPDSITSGNQLLGFTNAGHIGYYFQGTTITGPGGTTGTALASAGGGQAYLTAAGYSTNHYPRLTGMTYYRQDGGTFNNTEFKLEDLTDFIRNTSLAVHLYAWDQNNVQHDLGLLTLGGDNRFGIIGTNGDSITRVSYVVTGGAIGRHKQTRLDSLTQSAVPEPATWALTLFGFGTLGMALRRRRQGEPLRRLRLDLPATI